MTNLRLQSNDPALKADDVRAMMRQEEHARMLWRKRNSIWRDGNRVVKRFSHRFPSPLVYAFRSSKAARSFTNATALISRGIETPRPIAFAELRGPLNLLLDSLYICDYSDALSLEEALAAAGDPRPLLDALAKFFADMHDRGCLHRDMNLTNIRVLPGSEPRFSVIDLNRMKIYGPESKPSPTERYDDLTRFSNCDDDFRYFATRYLHHSRIPDTELETLIEVKRRHDRRVDNKKRWKRLLRFRKR